MFGVWEKKNKKKKKKKKKQKKKKKKKRKKKKNTTKVNDHINELGPPISGHEVLIP